MAPGFGYCMSPFWTAPSLGCMPMSFPGFYRSQINWDMVHEQGRYNIAANLMDETMNTNALMYQVRDLRYNQGYTNPYFGGFNLPNPKDYAAALQPQLNAMFTQFMNNINNQANAVNNNNTVNNPNTGDPKKDECIRLKGILQDFQTLNNTKSIYGKGSATEQKIAAALNKTGTDDEILAALKEAVQYIATNYKDQLRNMLLAKGGIVEMLTASGYNMSPSVLSSDTDDEKKLKTGAETVVSKLSTGSEFSDTTEGFIYFNNGSDENILRTLSYMNDAAATKGKTFIQIAVDGEEKAGSKDTIHKVITNAANSLNSKASSVISSDIDETIKTQLRTASEKLMTELKNYQDAEYKKDKAAEFVKSFNNLYAMLRLVTAQQAQNKVRTEYGYLNNTVKDFIDNDMIVKETRTDLENEKIGTVPTVDLAKMRTKVEAGSTGGSSGSDPAKTPAEIVKDLSSSSKGVLSAVKKVAGQGEYYEIKIATAGVCKPKYYTIKDGKLVELKNVTNINSAGKCTIKGETTTSDLKDVISNNSEEVSSEDIENYKKFADAINKKTSDGTIKKTKAQDEKGEYTIFRSKTGKLYALKDDKVYSIDNIALIKSKQNVNGTVALKLDGLIGSEVSASDIA